MNKTPSKSKEVRTPRYLSLVVPLRKVGDEAIHKELGDRMERAATTTSSSEAEQDSGSGPRCQDTILGYVNVQTRFETTSKQSNDPPLLKVNTFGSGEDSMKILELMAIARGKDSLGDYTSVLRAVCWFKLLKKLYGSIPPTDSTQIPIIDQYHLHPLNPSAKQNQGGNHSEDRGCYLVQFRGK
ncbi:hypothetical protein Tco_0685862 [Tanacetum coccineum]